MITKYVRIWNKADIKHHFQIGSCDVWIMQDNNELFDLCSKVHAIKGQQYVYANGGEHTVSFFDFELENAIAITKENFVDVLTPIINNFLILANQTQEKIKALTPSYVTLTFENWLSLKYKSLGSCVQYSTIRDFGKIPMFSELYESYRNAYHHLCKENCMQEYITFDSVFEIANNCKKDEFVNYMNR